jgi:hypothetical protein
MIADAEQELKDARLWNRLLWLGVFLALLIEATLVGVAITKHYENWANAAGGFGSFALFLGGPFAIALLFTSDSPCGRTKIIELATNIQRLRLQKQEQIIGRAKSKSAQYARYKESMPSLIERYRLIANHYRRVYNSLQAFIIVGSLSASTLGGAFWPNEWARWAATGITLSVGIASAIGSHFKLNERSNEMQKTSDAIEVEFRAAEFLIGDYAELSIDDALRRFVETVERIRTEHMLKKRQLDQPSDVRFVDVSSIG